jgi:hypothetical protein
VATVAKKWPPRAAGDSGTAYVHVKDHGAKLDGTTDDTAALLAAAQACQALGGGRVFVPGWALATSVTLFANVVYVGIGEGASGIKRANGVSADFVKTSGYDANTGTTNVGADHDYGFENLSLVGNSANNTAGRGIAAYGYRPIMRWVEVTDFNDVGYDQEWRATAGTPSSGLAEHDMHGRIVGLDVHDNLGGGIDWSGPSDSNAISCDIYRNGPAAASTTKGLRVRGNGNSFRASHCHVWGTQHDIGASIEASGFQSHQSDYEGSITAPIVVDASNGVIKGGKIFTPGASSVGIQFGVAGHPTVGGWDVDTFMSACNVNLVRDGGGNTWRIHAFWADATKKLFTGTMSAGTPSYYDCFCDGGLQLGLANFSAVATRRARIRDVLRHARPGRPDNVLYESFSRFNAADALTGFTLGQFVAVLMDVEADQPISGVGFIPAGTIPATPSHCWYALFDAATKAFIAATVDDVTGLAADTDHPLAIATGPTVSGGVWVPAADQRIYAACVMNGASGTFTLEGCFSTAGSIAKTPKGAGLGNSGLTDPATFAGANLSAALTGGTKVPYAYLF